MICNRLHQLQCTAEKKFNGIRIVDPMLLRSVDHVGFVDLRIVDLEVVVEIEYSEFLHLGRCMQDHTRRNHELVVLGADNDVVDIPVVGNQIVDLIHTAIWLDLDTPRSWRLDLVIEVGQLRWIQQIDPLVLLE